MVTASHNPPQDNGYKVYLGDGSQIVPPADAEISARIAAIGRLADVPRGEPGTVLGEDIVDRYLDTVADLAGGRTARPTHRLHAAARRGRHVGGPGARDRRLRRSAGRQQQEEPDPDFPTVAFPNPEEPGAMDLAMALAAERTTPTWWSPTTRTPTAAPPRYPARTGGGCCAATRSAPCSPTTCSARGAQGHLRRLDRVVVAARQAWPRPPVSTTSRPSPASSGSAGFRAWRSATRRRWATASTPSTCETRTASRRC